jgi:hypothetical protein
MTDTPEPKDSESKTVVETSPKLASKTQKMSGPEVDKAPEEKEKRGFKFPKLPWPPGYLVLWVIVLASVTMNVIVLRQIVLARQAAQQSIDDAIAILSDLRESTFTYTFPVDDTLMIETDVPIHETVPVPIHEVVEVRTAATVTLLDIPGIGPITHSVPVAADVPIDEEFEFEINEVFPISVPVDVNFDVPIAVALSDTPLYDTLGATIARLEALSHLLGEPLVPNPLNESD